MSKENGYLGERIQINSSNIITSQNSKYDPYTGNTLEQMYQINQSVAQMMGKSLDLNLRKIDLLSSVQRLSGISGGPITLKRVNELVRENERISPSDIAKHNFEKLFKEPLSVFTEEDLQEIRDLIRGDYTTYESKTVDYSRDLTLVTEYMKQNYSWTGQQSLNFIRSKIEVLKKSLKDTGSFIKDEEVENIKRKIFSFPMKIDYSEIDNYLNTAFLFDESTRSKDKLIDVLNGYYPSLEKNATMRSI